jgi:hypothetical protein
MKATNLSWRSWSFWKPVVIACTIVSLGVSSLPAGGSVMLAILIVLLTILAGGRYSATAPDWMREISRLAVRYQSQAWLVGAFWGLSCMGAIEQDLDRRSATSTQDLPLMVSTSNSNREPERSSLIPYEVVEASDLDNAARAKRVHKLLVRPGHSPEEIRALLTSYAHDLWEQLKESPAPSRGCWIYIFDDRRRAELGADDWVGMVANVPQGFTEWPAPIVRGSNRMARPSARDEEIYDYYQDHLWGRGLTDVQVTETLRAKYGVSKQQFEEAFLRVWQHRHAES